MEKDPEEKKTYCEGESAERSADSDINLRYHYQPHVAGFTSAQATRL
jgi:hypothetical protein